MATNRTPRDIGVDVKHPPAAEDYVEDGNDPFFGDLRVRGQIITGKITSLRMQNTAVVSRQYTIYIPKFERYESRTSKLTAHVPNWMIGKLKEGQEVKIMECRPISKTKKFVVIDRREDQ
jgi:small subunit ribosomal protein S17